MTGDSGEVTGRLSVVWVRASTDTDSYRRLGPLVFSRCAQLCQITTVLFWAVIFLSDMDALFQRLHNFMLPLMRGKDHVCQCTCGRHEAYHVVPFYGGLSMVDSTKNDFGSDIMSRQEKDVIAGLLVGFCIGWFLLWLNGIWHLLLKVWRANQHDS